MNNIINWLKSVPLEIYILFFVMLIVLILVIFTIIKIVHVNRRLGDQDFEILESIVNDEQGVLHFDFTVSNKAFSTNYLNTVGFKKGNVVQRLGDANIAIAPRTKHVSSFLMEHIENLTIKNATKFRKIRLFAENELGLRQESKGKVINKYLKRTYVANRQAIKRKAKEERFETGNYKFGERVWLVVKLFFRPFYKLAVSAKDSTNRALKESEVRRIHKAEHDKIEKKLTITTAKANELKIKEESYKENKTRETMLELLKQEKILEIEKLKLEAYEQAFAEKKEEILTISPTEEFKKYIEKNPIDFDNIEADVLRQLLADIKEEIEQESKQKQAPKPKKKPTPKPVEKEVEEPVIETEKVEEIVVEEVPVKEEITEEKPLEALPENLEELKLSELKDLARERKVPKFSTMKKAELIEALKDL